MISVVIPTHNRPILLGNALASVWAQTSHDYEIIVVSNGESDFMQRVSRSVAADYRAKYVTLPDGNVGAARNAGVKLARGEWVAFLDDDDLWEPTKLERQYIAAKWSGADVIGADWIEFWPNDKERVCRPRCPEGWSYHKAIVRGWWRPAMGSSPLIRKETFTSVGGFDTSLRIAEDIDLIRRISWRHVIHQMDVVLMRYRRGHASLSLDIRELAACDLCHFRKMRLDTPDGLRRDLPPAALYVPPRFMLLHTPKRLQNAIGALRPRRRWIALRKAMSLRWG